MNMNPANRCPGSGSKPGGPLGEQAVCRSCFRKVRVRVGGLLHIHSRYDHAPRRTEGRPA